MWLILQQKKPDDFVISTGKQITVKNFVNLVSKNLKIKIKWKGRGINEKAVDEKGNVIVACNRAYYRPLEVNSLLGDSRKARRTLGWKPKVNINELISDMVNTEFKNFPLESMKIFLAGHKGLVGSAILRKLIKKNIKILF